MLVSSHLPFVLSMFYIDFKILGPGFNCAHFIAEKNRLSYNMYMHAFLISKFFYTQKFALYELKRPNGKE